MLPFGEVNAVSVFFTSLNHILQKEESILPSDGIYMSPNLPSSTRKKKNDPFPVFPEVWEGHAKDIFFGRNIFLNFRLKGNSKYLFIIYMMSAVPDTVERGSMYMGNSGV